MLKGYWPSRSEFMREDHTPRVCTAPARRPVRVKVTFSVVGVVLLPTPSQRHFDTDGSIFSITTVKGVCPSIVERSRGCCCCFRSDVVRAPAAVPAISGGTNVTYVPPRGSQPLPEPTLLYRQPTFFPHNHTRPHDHKTNSTSFGHPAQPPSPKERVLLRVCRQCTDKLAIKARACVCMCVCVCVCDGLHHGGIPL